MAALNLRVTAPPAVALVQNLVQTKRKKQPLFTKNNDAICGRAIAKNNDFTVRLRHLPSLFIYFLSHLLFLRCIQGERWGQIVIACVHAVSC